MMNTVDKIKQFVKEQKGRIILYQDFEVWVNKMIKNLFIDFIQSQPTIIRFGILLMMFYVIYLVVYVIQPWIFEDIKNN